MQPHVITLLSASVVTSWITSLDRGNPDGALVRPPAVLPRLRGLCGEAVARGDKRCYTIYLTATLRFATSFLLFFFFFFLFFKPPPLLLPLLSWEVGRPDTQTQIQTYTDTGILIQTERWIHTHTHTCAFLSCLLACLFISLFVWLFFALLGAW